MVINGGARAGAGELAFHLQRTDTNERMHVRELRGVAAENLTDALHEMEAVASGARTRRPFYHASINTPADERMTEGQKERAIQRLEDELGLTGQPRVVVEHVKHDREHIHVAWSRVNAETMTAIPDSHNYHKHEVVGRELEREFGHARVQGAHHEREGVERPERCPSYAEMRQAERSGVDPRDRKADLTIMWRMADSGQAFAASLEDAGWKLARGDRRGFVALDPTGETHAINKHITGLTAAKVRERLAGLDLDRLPSVDEARAQLRDREQAREDAAREKARAEPARDELAELAAQIDANVRQRNQERTDAMWDQPNGSTLSNIRQRDREAQPSRSTEHEARRAMDDLARTDPLGTARHFGHRAGDRLKSPEDMRREMAERMRGYAADPQPEPARDQAAPDPGRDQAEKPAAQPTPEPQQGHRVNDQVQPRDPAEERAAWAARLRGMAPPEPARAPEPVTNTRAEAQERPREREKPRPDLSHLQAALSAARERLDGLGGRLDATLTTIREQLRDREAAAVHQPKQARQQVPQPRPVAEPERAREATRPTREAPQARPARDDTSSRKVNRDFADELIEEARRRAAQEAEARRSVARDHYRTEREREGREYRRVRDLIRMEKRARRPQGPK